MKQFGLIYLLLILFFSCQNSTEPASREKPNPEQKSITETDSAGRFTGYFDHEDWVPQNVFFDNSIMIEPHNCIHFLADEDNRWDTRIIGFKNLTSVPYHLYFDRLKAPFSTGPEKIELAAGSVDSISISFFLAEDHETDVLDSLIIKNQNKKSVIIRFWGLKSTPNLIIPICPVERYTFGPAFPNPMKNETELIISIPIKTGLSLVVLDGSKQIKMLMNGEFLPGLYRLRWNGTDDTGKKVAPGIYKMLLESDQFTSSGDIQIIQ
ncbi:hypothetical protein JW935_26325 [candidate division KSB1 bacterium]|nr:hypothetical protein [candidate division KSB1 bacterium]